MIIGIIDTGIDFNHPEFRRGDSTKILALWDQLDTTRNNYRFDDGTVLGSVYYGREINPDFCNSRDVDGHGTMVASIAAGNTCGIAPDAHLVIVKADYIRFDEMVIAHGIDFIRQEAMTREMPYIFLLCYLPKGGAKDGETGVLARILNGELAEALGGGLLKGVVAAAGNENYAGDNPCREENNRMHVHKAGNGSFSLEIETTDNDIHDDLVVMELWYPVENPYEVRVISPSGRVYGPVAPDQGLFRELGPDGYISISNNSRNMTKWGAIKLVLRDPDSSLAFVHNLQPLKDGDWTVEMIGEQGVWHGYIVYVYPDDLVKAVSKKDHTNRFKIRSGGNVRDVITVGSLDNDAFTWTCTDGTDISFSRCHQRHQVSHSSSRGPSRTGVNKPELYAEGAWVRVAASQDIAPGIAEEIGFRFLADQPLYLMASGTSFSAPRVAGTVAIMVGHDADNSLTHDRIKYILEQTARKRGKGRGSYYCLDIKKAVELSRKY